MLDYCSACSLSADRLGTRCGAPLMSGPWPRVTSVCELQSGSTQLTCERHHCNPTVGRVTSTEIQLQAGFTVLTHLAHGLAG